ncbi:MAG: hypothetical protein R3A47_09440 [Polyangiales bacterium]
MTSLIPDMSNFFIDGMAWLLPRSAFHLSRCSCVANSLSILRNPYQIADYKTFYLRGERRTTAKWMLGFRYMSDKLGLVSVEYAQGTVGAQNTDLVDVLRPNPTTLAALWSRGLLNDRMNIELFALSFGPHFSGGATFRGAVGFKLTDEFSMHVGYLGFAKGKDSTWLRGYETNHRAFLRFRYDFSTL